MRARDRETLEWLRAEMQGKLIALALVALWGLACLVELLWRRP